MSDLQQQVQQDIQNHKVIAYIKGTKQMPVCGFSMKVVKIFTALGVDFVTRNALEDEGYRAALKSITDWHTIPQVFVDGQFIGGCDIVVEMYESGDLQDLLKVESM